jgi:DNA-binding NtrC family response regulator
MELVLREKRDSFQRPNWEPLFQALGLSFLQVALGGKVLVRLGPGPALWQGEVAGFQVELAPAPEEEILALLSLVCSQASLAQERLAEDHQALGLSGTSPALEALRQEIRRFGPLPITVLICGEPGTGKERVARALHQVSGRTGPFVAVNCAGVPEGLLEAELFGVVRGAFTGADRDRPGLVEQAEGGTLFLDEIGELPLAMQAKLLRLLQEKEVRRLGDLRARKVDVRFVAATNRDLRQAVQAGSFRQDLYDRLATVVLRVPPLRQRPEDIPLLVRELVSGFSRQLGLPSVTIAGEVMAHLAQQSWPGNVRQLEAVLIQALARCRPGEMLSLRHLTAEHEEAVPPLLPWEEAKRRFARQYFGRLLAACNGNRSEAAKRAGLSRQALHYHLDQLGLPQEEPS